MWSALFAQESYARQSRKYQIFQKMVLAYCKLTMRDITRTLKLQQWDPYTQFYTNIWICESYYRDGAVEQKHERVDDSYW